MTELSVHTDPSAQPIGQFTVDVTAAILRQSGAPLVLESVELAEPRSDEVLVRLSGTGICHTDLGFSSMAAAEQLPLVLGHEGAGIVEAIGSDVTAVGVGDHVVLSYSSCGRCRNCRRDKPQYCAANIGLNFAAARLDGSTAMTIGDQAVHTHFFGQSSFAERIVTYERNCVVVDDDLPLELLGPLGCGFQTGAGAVLNTLNVQGGDSIAIFGVGSVGLAAVMAAKIAGAEQIIAVDRIHARLTLATELGAMGVVNAADADAVDAIRELTGGGVDYSIDCVGAPAVVSQALAVLVPPGMCVTLGLQGYVNEMTIDQAQLLFGRGIRGVLEGDSVPATFIPRLIDEYRAGRFPIDALVQTFAFEDINQGIAALAQSSVVKPIVVFGN